MIQEMATHNWMSFKGKSILCVDLSLQPLRDNKIQGFNGQTNQETTSGADKIKKCQELFQSNIRIQSGMLMFFYDRFSYLFFLRSVISIFFIGICTDTSVFEAA